MFSLYYLLYEFDKIDKIWEIQKLRRNFLDQGVSSIDDDYLEAAIGGVVKNFVIFTGKQLCWSLFLIKLQACKFVEKILQHWCFPLHVRKFLRIPILKNISERLLLIILLAQQFFNFRMSLSIAIVWFTCFHCVFQKVNF